MRLQGERAALAERERELDAAMQSQRLDEALLTQQQDQWVVARQSWARAGGSMGKARSLQHDKTLLVDMAALLARARAALEARAERLAEDIHAWNQAWHAAQEFARSLAERGRLLGIAQQRADERTQDEESLIEFANTRHADSRRASVNTSTTRRH